MLDKILSNKAQEIAQSKTLKPLEQIRIEAEKLVSKDQPIRQFRNSISSSGFSLIAEIKRKSPSHGEIRKELDLLDVAKTYEEAAGVSCISVLTDVKYFGGSLTDLKQVRSATTKPVLRKEFIIDEYQLYEARTAGADAVLLISTILEKKQLCDLVDLTRHLKMEPFIECHTQSDLEKIPFSRIDVVGINSRDLVGTLKTDLTTIEKMLPFIPRNKLIVAESGVHTGDDLKWLYDLGVNAVLIGTGILTSESISQAITDLLAQIPS